MQAIPGAPWLPPKILLERGRQAAGSPYTYPMEYGDRASRAGDSEATFKSLVRDMQVGVLLQGPGAEILLCNPAALDLLGLDEDQLLGKTSFDPDWNVIREDGSPYVGAEHPVPTAIATGRAVRNAVLGVYRPKPGDRAWLLVDAIPELDAGGTVRRVVCTFIDITERKRAEAQVQELLAEKEIILKEVHHRIKNNMSTIYAILSLHARAAVDPPAAAALEDAGSRVQCMMLLYDKLYKSAGFQEASIKEYLPDLIEEIAANFPNRRSVLIATEVDDITLDAAKLSTLGIIVNELLTNIMKYAFVGRASGRIEVSAVLSGNLVTLAIQDDGCGMPEAIDLESSTGFGLSLVAALTKQLQGSIRIERGKGTRIVLEFGLR